MALSTEIYGYFSSLSIWKLWLLAISTFFGIIYAEVGTTSFTNVAFAIISIVFWITYAEVGTTSAITYTVQIAASSATASFGVNNTPSSIFAYEIGA